MTPLPRSLPLVALALGVAILVLQIRVIAGGQTWDDVRYHTEVAPSRLAAATAIQRGDLPAWWDGTGLGVPLAGEPSHGALYPPGWIAAVPHALDLVVVAHLAWAALGVAVWARRRASDRSALVAGVLVATTGILMSAALRGALPGLAHLPWLGAASSALGSAAPGRPRARLALAIGGLIAAIALTGELAALIDGVAIALALGLGRPAARWLVAAIAAGLAIGALQWIPALLQLPAGVGAEVAALPLARLIELVVPSASGASAADHALPALAGAAPWAPSLFAGAALLALAAVRVPARRQLGVIGGLVIAALVWGRGGWPAWLGAPELHVGALVVVLAVAAADGLDELVRGQRRAVRALAAGAGLAALGLAALAGLRAQHGELAPAIDRTLLDGGLGVACMAGAVVLAWRTPGRRVAVLFALVVAPSVGAAHAIAPMIDRAIASEPPAWARLAQHVAPPARVFRPQALHDQPGLEDALATFAGGSAWRWGIAAARSEDPARLPADDAAWLASAHEGGVLLDRYAIALAILPSTMIAPRRMSARGRRGAWSLVELPTAPVASVMHGWRWAIDPDDAFALLFPEAGGTGVLRGTIVLAGTGDAGPTGRDPEPCTVRGWRDGDIALACTSATAGYAVVSSTTSPGWRVTVDDVDAPWLTADVLRRAVAIPAGAHRVHWQYSPPGAAAGAGLALAGLAGLIVLGVLVGRRRPAAPDEVTN